MQTIEIATIPSMLISSHSPKAIVAPSSREYIRQLYITRVEYYSEYNLYGRIVRSGRRFSGSKFNQRDGSGGASVALPTYSLDLVRDDMLLFRSLARRGRGLLAGAYPATKALR